MVDKRPTRRKRRTPPKNASGKKALLKNARAPENAQPPMVGQKGAGAKALGEAVPAPEPEALMRMPGFRRRVIHLVVQKLC